MAIDNNATAMNNDGGWIDLNGYYHACGCEGHADFAEDHDTTVWALEDEGWIHISDGRIYNMRNLDALTQPQIDTLFDGMMLYPDYSIGQKIKRLLSPMLEEVAQ